MMGTLSFIVPKRILIESHNDDGACDACDVIVENEDSTYFTGLFVTPAYLARQMDLSYAVARSLPDAPPVRYAVFETPHIVVDDLSRDTIEDTIDNLIALDTFGSVFTRVTDEEGDEVVVTAVPSRRATAEVTAVVLNEVLFIDDRPAM
jgi:hypothetical protein